MLQEIEQRLRQIVQRGASGKRRITLGMAVMPSRRRPWS
jgi:hypothetical protein